jgi:hypothetical protein
MDQRNNRLISTSAAEYVVEQQSSHGADWPAEGPLASGVRPLSLHVLNGEVVAVVLAVELRHQGCVD